MNTQPATNPPSSDPLDILLAHDHWATRELLVLCRGLSREEFHRSFPIGLGSLHENFTHIISAMRRWCDRIMERPPRPSLHAIPSRPDIPCEIADRTPDDLIALLDGAAKELTEVAQHTRRVGLGSTISMEWPSSDGGKKRYTFTRSACLVHVTTHGMHHRAQCLNMLRHLNHPGISDKLPEIAVVEWQSSTELPPVSV